MPTVGNWWGAMPGTRGNGEGAPLDLRRGRSMVAMITLEKFAPNHKLKRGSIIIVSLLPLIFSMNRDTIHLRDPNISEAM
jgi:hypothetical protein